MILRQQPPCRKVPAFAFLAFFGMIIVAADAGRAETLRSPDLVRSCLCMERSVSALAHDVQVEHGTYEQSRKQVDELDAEVASRRNKVNTTDEADVDAFRRLLERRDQAATRFSDTTTPAYTSLVERYNRRVADFNAQCGGKSYDSAVLAAVQAGLSCSSE
jgi:hypothetical protein